MACTCLLLDREDGERFLRRSDPADVALALTPEASAAVISGGGSFYEPSRKQLWWASARATVVARRVLQQLHQDILSNEQLSPAGEFALDRMLRRAVVTGIRVWTVLGGIERYAWIENGEWRNSSDRRVAYTALMKRIAPGVPVSDFAPGSWRMDLAQTWLSFRIARRQKMKGALFYNTLVKHFNAIGAAVAAEQPKTAQFGTVKVPSPSWEKIRQLKKGLRSLPAQGWPHFVVSLDLRAYRRGARRASARLARFTDPRLQVAIAAERDAIVSEVAATEGYATWLQRLFFWQRPKAIFLNAMSVGLNVALAQAGRRRGVPVFLVSHCSVGEGPMEDRLLSQAMSDRNSDLTASPFADVQIVQSPHAEAVVAKLAPQTRLLRIQPSIWGLKRVVRTERLQKRFRILHAGNFQAWSNYEAFSSECSLEYCAGIIEIARVVQQLPGCELVIRMKPGFEYKAECLVQSVQAQLPPDFQGRFSTSGSFYDELAEADLVVSSTSTVVEEAIMNGIPVLLHSGSWIRPFLPASTQPPTATGRHAVYAAKDSAALPAMLEAIARAHAAGPLTPEEIAPHVWGSGQALDLGELAKLLATGNLKTDLPN